jgi:hypothetical protein
MLRKVEEILGGGGSPRWDLPAKASILCMMCLGYCLLLRMCLHASACMCMHINAATACGSIYYRLFLFAAPSTAPNNLPTSFNGGDEV